MVQAARSGKPEHLEASMASATGIENPDPAIAANVIIGLIRVTTTLLDRQLRNLKETFVKEGGLR